MTIRIAMWSGPRNISTAMMRAFENRPDTVVVDEPLYGHYLATTGKAHPAADEVMRAQSTDWRDVAAQLGPTTPVAADVFYQKHMAHHICGDMTLTWTDPLQHGFLLRDPAAMLTSLSRVLDEVRLEDTGLEQQVRLYRHLRAQGRTPPVIDSRD
ncbi:MAG: HAD family hydrolase, partial [Pseudomonadota bacterium]